ncbi:MAG: hypothetical protein JHC30_06120 [Caldisericum sp.]|nr:hypothetical protein [Caldisericum sp.]
MREIKFRAWIVKENKMVTVYKLDFFTKDNRPTLIMWYLLDTGTQAGLFAGFELMQYTGLKDKNGKEIYEGDIVKYDNHLYIVKWLDKFVGFMGVGVDQERSDLFLDLVFLTPYKVVGNIYENPELLGGEK